MKRKCAIRFVTSQFSNMATNLIQRFIPVGQIVVIFGATGTGKSKLAIEVAKKFNGEVISIDSMQVYVGLDIVTNKVTEEEQSGVPHHLINFVNPFTGITAIDFRDKTLKIMEEVRKREKLPVLVGGTMYYLESILFDFLLPEPKNSDDFDYSYDAGFDGSGPNKRRRCNFEELSDEELYQRVSDIDPDMMEVLHPGDRRRLSRCLEVYEKSGRKLSYFLKRQKSQPGGNNFGGPMRFPGAILLWLQCKKETLDRRLNERVDKMLEQGLIQELVKFHEEYNKMRLDKNESADYTKGIFQAIGFKEFHEYLILDEEQRNSEKGVKLLESGIENMKLVTRRYAKKQVKWIENRFLKRGVGQMPPIYGLDATDLTQWNEKVTCVAVNIIESIRSGRQPDYEPLPLKPEVDSRTVYKCDDCNRYFKGKNQYESHLMSSKHKRVLRKARELIEANDDTNPDGSNAEEMNLQESENDKSQKKIATDC